MKRCMKYFICSIEEKVFCGLIFGFAAGVLSGIFGALFRNMFLGALSVIFIVTGIESNSIFSLRTRLIACCGISKKYQCSFLPIINGAARLAAFLIPAAALLIRSASSGFSQEDVYYLLALSLRNR